MTEKEKKPKKFPWKDENYVAVYKMALSGMDNKEIAKCLGVPIRIFDGWVESQGCGALRKALIQARNDDTAHGRVPKYKENIRSLLSPECQALWDEIMLTSRGDWNARQLVILKLEQSPTRQRQQLFLHALEHCNYSVPDACKMIGTNSMIVNKWKKEDPEFAELFVEVSDTNVKYFFQSCLVERAKEGDVPSAIFGSKTKGKELGYSERTDVNVNVSGQIDHNHQHSIYNMDDVLRVLSVEEKAMWLSWLDRVDENRSDKQEVKRITSDEVRVLPNALKELPLANDNNGEDASYDVLP